MTIWLSVTAWGSPVVLRHMPCAASRNTFRQFIRATVAGIAQSMATQISSTAHDVARGRRSEIDYINGYVLRRAAIHGIQTPVNRTILALVRLLEPHNAESLG
jgi:ketopantoate reductase